jgi:hypothetical protein
MALSYPNVVHLSPFTSKNALFVLPQPEKQSSDDQWRKTTKNGLTRLQKTDNAKRWNPLLPIFDFKRTQPTSKNGAHA